MCDKEKSILTLIPGHHPEKNKQNTFKFFEKRLLKVWLHSKKCLNQLFFLQQKEIAFSGLSFNGTAHIRQQCRKTTVLSCHGCLIKTGLEKMNSI
jgi:hypothetical protein